jgi:hypothetical protein
MIDEYTVLDSVSSVSYVNSFSKIFWEMLLGYYGLCFFMVLILQWFLDVRIIIKVSAVCGVFFCVITALLEYYHFSNKIISKFELRHYSDKRFKDKWVKL